MADKWTERVITRAKSNRRKSLLCGGRSAAVGVYASISFAYPKHWIVAKGHGFLVSNAREIPARLRLLLLISDTGKRSDFSLSFSVPNSFKGHSSILPNRPIATVINDIRNFDPIMHQVGPSELQTTFERGEQGTATTKRIARGCVNNAIIKRGTRVRDSRNLGHLFPRQKVRFRIGEHSRMLSQPITKSVCIFRTSRLRDTGNLRLDACWVNACMPLRDGQIQIPISYRA